MKDYLALLALLWWSSFLSRLGKLLDRLEDENPGKIERFIKNKGFSFSKLKGIKTKCIEV